MFVKIRNMKLYNIYRNEINFLKFTRNQKNSDTAVMLTSSRPKHLLHKPAQDNNYWDPLYKGHIYPTFLQPQQEHYPAQITAESCKAHQDGEIHHKSGNENGYYKLENAEL